MKYRLTKIYGGNIELLYNENIIVYLTDANPSITLTDDEYFSMPENKKDYVRNGLIVVETIEDEIEIPKQNFKKQK